MARGIIVALLVIIAALLVFEFFEGDLRAQTVQPAVNFSQVLQNQKLILEKLDQVDQKLDQLKMRVR